MRWLFAVFLASLCALLWAAFSVARHIRRNAKAVPQTLLYTGDRLSLAADAHVQLVVLSDLHKERLQPGREATICRISVRRGLIMLKVESTRL